MSAFFYAKICSLLARRRSSQPVQRVYWPENVIDWLGKWRPTCVMRHARGQKLQSFRRKWPFYMDLYSMVRVSIRIHKTSIRWLDTLFKKSGVQHFDMIKQRIFRIYSADIGVLYIFISLLHVYSESLSS